MRSHCEVCGLAFERGEDGYQVGSYMFNIAASEAVLAVVFLAVVAATWPSPPWTWLDYGGAALMIAAPLQLDLPDCRIRSWCLGDEPAMARHANNRKIWLNVRDRFPHPYTMADAEAWVLHATTATPETQFAIEVDGKAAGGVGLFLQTDVERYSAEIGYWLGEAFWGRGLATAVVRRFTNHAFDAFELCRIYANVFEWNTGSCRVLEKAGYLLEGRLRSAAVKDGSVLDGLLYAAVREFPPGRGPRRPG